MSMPTPAAKKKPFYLRWWFIVLVVILVGGPIASQLNKSEPASMPTPIIKTPSATPTVPAGCTVLDATELDAINEGASGERKAVAGAALPLPSSQDRVAQVRLSDESTALLILGESGWISGVDVADKDAFTWGTAAQPGSSVAKYQAKVAGSQTARDVASCPTV